MFDQPDLKANLTFSTICPSDWNVISNENSKVDQSRLNAVTASLVEAAKIFGQNQDFVT